jgi:hypothetical protein
MIIIVHIVTCFFHSPNLVILAERSVPNVALGMIEKLEKWKLNLESERLQKRNHNRFLRQE